ncbi:MAG: fibronectin type III domain-containing protein [Ruminococcus sp.]|nr:fibronectin type III domain-containing protein [Ruminococcus sp.]
MKRLISVFAAIAILITIAVPVSAVSKPAAPRLKSVSNSSKGVLLKWSKVKNAAKYYVFRKTAKVKYKKIATVKTTSYTHKSAVSGNKYTYKIYAVNAKGKSKASNQKTVTRVGTPSVKTSNTEYAIKVSWPKVKKATSYVVLYKASTAKKYKVLYRGKECSYLYYNLAVGTKYNFKVRANIGKLKGVYSAVKSQFFLTHPSVSAQEPESMKGIYLDWSPVKHATGYIIYRSLKSENAYKRIKKTTDTKTTYLDTDVKSINTYKYYVVAYTTGGYKSAKSNVATEIYGYLESFSKPLTLSIKKGEVYKDIYNKLSYYGANVFITWKSEKTSVAKVDSNGIITGVKKGTAAVKATIDPELFSFFGRGDITTKKTITINVTVK